MLVTLKGRMVKFQYCELYWAFSIFVTGSEYGNSGAVSRMRAGKLSFSSLSFVFVVFQSLKRRNGK